MQNWTFFTTHVLSCQVLLGDFTPVGLLLAFVLFSQAPLHLVIDLVVLSLQSGAKTSVAK